MQDVAQALYTYLLEEFPADRSYTAADLDQAPMPVAVSHFIKQLLERRYQLEIDNWRDMRSLWFDYGAAEITEAVAQTETLLQAYARVPAKTWAATLEEAVTRVLGHLVEPADMLADFVFRDLQETLPLPAILERMHYFHAYPYLARATQAYAEHKDLTEYRHQDFRRLLLSWDQKITADYKPHRWLRMLEPLYDFVTTLPALRTQGVPVDILRRFFESKGADDIVEQLGNEAQQGTTALDEIALRRVLEAAEGKLPDVLAAISDETAAAAPDQHPKPAAEPVQEKAPIAPKVSAAPQPAGPVPLWMRFQQERSGGLHGDGDHQEPEAPATPPEAAETDPAALDPTAYGSTNEAPTQHVPLWQRFRAGDNGAAGSASPKQHASSGAPTDTATAADTASDAVAHKPSQRDAAAEEAADLMVAEPSMAKPSIEASRPTRLDTLEAAVLGTSQSRTHFVRDLFGGSTAAYEATLQRLHEAASWRDATEIIATDVFKKHQVDIYSGAAIAFTNAAQQRFGMK